MYYSEFDFGIRAVCDDANKKFKDSCNWVSK